MTKHKFKDISLGKTNRERLITINDIIDDYAAQGYKLTLRQLYYQLVSRDIIPNKQAEYAKLSRILTQGRMGGIVDWEAIEDRLRTPYIPYWVRGPKDALQDSIDQYRLNRQQGQETYIEVWVEKDALSGVLRRITSKYHVNLMVNRGYSSCTAMHDAYERIKWKLNYGSKNAEILYLGDHDPSGLDMIRDIRDRLGEMLDQERCRLTVKPIALTMNQIEAYDPPPNPTKITDPRADWYIDRYGETCWEVDALPPEALNKLVSTSIKDSINMDLFSDMLIKEEEDKEVLKKLKEKV